MPNVVQACMFSDINPLITMSYELSLQTSTLTPILHSRKSKATVSVKQVVAFDANLMTGPKMCMMKLVDRAD